MNIKILEMTDDSARLEIDGVDYAFVNALRRTLIADVPKLAIEDIEIHLGAISDEDGKTYESTTPLFDEIIAHRMGLIPIPTDIEVMNFRDECTCDGEGCSNCSVMYSLNKKGPCTVYSGDLEPLGDEKLRPKDSKIPIVKLTEDEGILIYATAILGSGKDHAKWQACHGAGYKAYPSVEIDAKKCDHGGKCIEYCPVGVFEKKAGKIRVKNVDNCTLCKSCVEVCELGAVTLGHDDSRFIFKFETDGALTARDALLYALRHLEYSFKEVVDILGEMKEKDYSKPKVAKKPKPPEEELEGGGEPDADSAPEDTEAENGTSEAEEAPEE